MVVPKARSGADLGHLVKVSAHDETAAVTTVRMIDELRTKRRQARVGRTAHRYIWASELDLDVVLRSARWGAGAELFSDLVR
jgi:hypothetical protein